MELRGLLKEQKSTECKEKESTDASGNSSDGQAEMRQSTETLQVKMSREKGDKNSNEVSDVENSVTTDTTVSAAEGMESLQAKGQSHRKREHVTKHGVSFYNSQQSCLHEV